MNRTLKNIMLFIGIGGVAYIGYWLIKRSQGVRSGKVIKNSKSVMTYLPSGENFKEDGEMDIAGYKVYGAPFIASKASGEDIEMVELRKNTLDPLVRLKAVYVESQNI